MAELTTPEQLEALTQAFGQAIDAMSPQERADFAQLAQQAFVTDQQQQRLIAELSPFAEGIELQRRASEIFAEADLAAHRTALQAAVQPVRDVLAGVEQAAQDADARARRGLELERHAADQAHAAAEYARQQREAAEDLAEAEAAPEEQTEGLLRRDRAAEVEARARNAAQAASEARAVAVAEQEATRAAVRRAKAEVREAETAVQRAEETVRPSALRIALDWPALLVSGIELTAEELGSIRLLITDAAKATGLDRQIKNRATEQVRGELRGEFDQALATIPASPNGNIVLPLNQQRDPRADRW